MVNLFLYRRVLSLEVSVCLPRRLRLQARSQLIISVALVVLASDSLEAVIPRFTSDQWKLLCFIVYVLALLTSNLIVAPPNRAFPILRGLKYFRRAAD